MKLIHLSDLHIGKKLSGFSRLDEQKYVFAQITDIIRDEKPDAVMIAGDVYDKTVPTEEAVQFFDTFLTELAGIAPSVLVLSGNHDSAERVAFGSGLLTRAGVYMSPVFGTSAEVPVTIEDANGMQADIFMLPFVKPAHVRRVYPESPVTSLTEAMRVAVGHMRLNNERPCVLMAHQYVVGAERCGSEDIPESIGGLDMVNAEVFDAFDYVALGHIHGAQSVGRETVRYSGTPIKYSLSEKRQEKSVTVVEIAGKGDVKVRVRPLKQMYEVDEIRGTFEEVTSESFRASINTQDYLQIVLTDEVHIQNGHAKLEQYYPRIIGMRYDNSRTKQTLNIDKPVYEEEHTPRELFSELFERVNGIAMNEAQANALDKLIAEIWR